MDPLLWNLVYDDVLNLEMPVGIRSVAFADDLALLEAVRAVEDLVLITNAALKGIADWMGGTNLRIAEHKTGRPIDRKNESRTHQVSN